MSQNTLYYFFDWLFVFFPLLLCVAFFTLAERKVMAAVQRRRGPVLVGPWGFLQPFADGVKLLVKGVIFPYRANTFIFAGAGLVGFIMTFTAWSSFSFTFEGVVADLSLSFLFILSVSSVNSYGIVFSGWSSNSKYALLGAIRSTAQVISYEVSLGLCVLPVFLFTGSLNLNDIVYWQFLSETWLVFPLFPVWLFFFFISLAETNRAPFDLPEAESELVAGYNVEYSSVLFSFFFIAEYCSILIMSSIHVVVFFGGWLFPFLMPPTILGFIVFPIKVTLFAFSFILVRTILPRYRYDQLMLLGWKVYLPVLLGILFFFVGVFFIFGAVPFSFVWFRALDDFSFLDYSTLISLEPSDFSAYSNRVPPPPLFSGLNQNSFIEYFNQVTMWFLLRS